MQLLGKHPYEEYEKFSTEQITTKLMRCMKADLSPLTVDNYKRNVALLVYIMDMMYCIIY